MSLAPGSRIGPYQVVAQIGVGGMGEVYRATDSRLGREVAIKVLPDAFALDAERLARFDREARTLASLNHPGIAHVYGVENAAGGKALVMELVEGPTLADRIAEGPISLEDALAIARQIADALEAAHEQGIIHRDLKPANVKVRPDGAVKVLDFGLAKALDPVSTASAGASMSPTITTPAMTQAGLILGTAAYMSPEQARGKLVDRRADIWAFGALLYEMLAGQRAFGGEDITVTLARVVEREPDFSALPAPVPARVTRVLQLCLRKDPRARISDVRDVRLALDGAFETASFVAPDPAGGVRPAAPLWRRALPTIAATLAVGAGALLMGRITAPDAPRPVVRSVHALPEGTAFRNAAWPVLAVDPEGQYFAYNSIDGLLLRRFDSFAEQVIPGTETANIAAPFFSSDGLSVGYFDFVDRQVKVVNVVGGAPRVLVATLDEFWGATWEADGTILYPKSNGIWEISENGGEPRRLVETPVGETPDIPQRLPGGDWLLFSVTRAAGPGRWNEAEVVVQSIGTGERRVVRPGGSSARYLPTGHLIYAHENVLYAAPFDLDRRQVSGSPRPVLQDVRRSQNAESTTGAAFYAVAAAGTLLYAPGTGGVTDTIGLALADRTGSTELLDLAPGQYDYPRVSPDGSQVAYVAGYTDGQDIAVHEIGTGIAPRRLTLGGRSRHPVWSPDGQAVVFQSDRDGDAALYSVASDGTGAVTRLTAAEEGTTHEPDSFSPDGNQLAFTVARNDTSEIWVLSLQTGETEPLIVQAGARVSQAAFSPDGSWIAYQSTETGESEVFVQPFPSGTRYMVPSEVENHHPFWSRDGRELLYVPGPGLFSVVSFRTEPRVGFGNPAALPLNGPLAMAAPITRRRVDAMPDGGFLGVPGNTAAEAGLRRINIVQHWFEELTRLVPVD